MKILGSFQQISDPNVSVVAEAERDRLATLETVAANRIQGLAKMKQAKAERIRLQAERDAISKEIQEFLDNYNLWHDVEVIGSQNPVDEFYAKYSENTRKYIDSFIKKKEGFNFHRDLSNHNFIKLSRNIPQKGIEYFIKELIMRDPTRKNDLNKTSQRGSFERGVVVISDLTASEAEKINQYLDTLDLYKRPSTHGDLVWGYDIPSNRYIESPNEIFRHVIFSKPKVTIQQILTAVHKFKQFSIKQHDQSIHCFNSMLSTGHQI